MAVFSKAWLLHSLRMEKVRKTMLYDEKISSEVLRSIATKAGKAFKMKTKLTLGITHSLVRDYLFGIF